MGFIFKRNKRGLVGLIVWMRKKLSALIPRPKLRPIFSKSIGFEAGTETEDRMMGRS
jgi:hypothetical protein